jgi:tRNA(Ile)-lysidine synthase
MLDPAQRVGVAVSGGADSMFLLHALRELAPRWNLKLSVIHIEHGIRGAASIADADFVRQLAENFGLPFHLRQVHVPSLPGNLEEASRNVRQSFYRKLIASGAVDRVATGHTRSDQAETVLFRILRGSGLTGLAGILPVTREGLIRPLLEIDRCEIEAWLRGHGIGWREDASNQDRSYARNRLRHEILPLLRAGFNPQLDAALARLATLARDEERYWTSALAPGQEPTAKSQRLVLPVSELANIPVAVARRRLHHALPGASFASIERVLEMARSAKGHDRFQAPGIDVCRSFEKIRIASEGDPPDGRRDFALVLSVPGSVERPGSSARITLQVIEKKAETSPYVTVVDELDWQRLVSVLGARGGAPSLVLRNWRPGDQYRRAGHSKPEKIKFFFQQARIPLWERSQWPIITYNGIIVWARQCGVAAEFATGPETRSVLRVVESDSQLQNPRDRV